MKISIGAKLGSKSCYPHQKLREWHRAAPLIFSLRKIDAAPLHFAEMDCLALEIFLLDKNLIACYNLEDNYRDQLTEGDADLFLFIWI